MGTLIFCESPCFFLSQSYVSCWGNWCWGIRWIWLVRLRAATAALGAMDWEWLTAPSCRLVDGGRPCWSFEVHLGTHFQPTCLEAQRISRKAGIQHLGGVWSNRVQPEGIGKTGTGGIRRQESSKTRGWGCQGKSCGQFCLRPGSRGVACWNLPEAVIHTGSGLGGIEPELKHRCLYLYPLPFCWSDF